MDTTRWFADNASATGAAYGVTLSPGEDAEVEATAEIEGVGTWTASRTIAWTPTVIDADSGQSVTVRKGDSLLLVTEETSGTLQIDLDYDGVTFDVDKSGPAGTPIPAAFNAAGVFTVHARVDGEFAGEMMVVVIDVDLSSPIACQVGFLREKDVTITPSAYASEVVFTAPDPACLGDVSVKEYTATGATIYLRALQRGTPVLTARVGGETGPIVAYKEVDEYTLDTTAAYYLVTADEDGGLAGPATITVAPLVSGLEVLLIMRSSGTSFDGGLLELSIQSDDFELQPDGSGTYDYRIHCAPGITFFCHDTEVWQHASPGRKTGTFPGVNGLMVRATIQTEPARIVFRKTKGFVVTFEKADPNRGEVSFKNVTFTTALMQAAKGGGAKVNAPTGSISGTTPLTVTVTVEGTVQVNLAGKKNVKLQVMHNGAEVCYMDFCVCAHPTGSSHHANPIETPNLKFGFSVRHQLTSDSDVPNDLVGGIVPHESVTLTGSLLLVEGSTWDLDASVFQGGVIKDTHRVPPDQMHSPPFTAQQKATADQTYTWRCDRCQVTDQALAHGHYLITWTPEDVGQAGQTDWKINTLKTNNENDTIGPQQEDYVEIPAPTNARVTATEDVTFTLAWDFDPADEEKIRGFQVRLRRQGGGWAYVASVFPKTSRSQYINWGNAAWCETAYDLEVRALGNTDACFGGASAWSNTAAGTTQALYPPQNVNSGFDANGESWLSLSNSTTGSINAGCEVEIYKNGQHVTTVTLSQGGNMRNYVQADPGDTIRYRVRGLRSKDGQDWESQWVETQATRPQE